MVGQSSVEFDDPDSPGCPGVPSDVDPCGKLDEGCGAFEGAGDSVQVVFNALKRLDLLEVAWVNAETAEGSEGGQLRLAINFRNRHN